MIGETPVGPRQSTAVAALGPVTLLLGVAYAVTGGGLTFVGDAMIAPPREGDPVGGFTSLFQLIGAMAIALGIAFLMLGGLVILAGVGLVKRWGWGRILTFVLCIPIALSGLGFLGCYDSGAAFIALGVAQLAYAISAIVVLINNGAAFSGQREGQMMPRAPSDRLE